MRADFPGKDKPDDGRSQFHDDGFPRSETYGVDWDPWGIHVDLELDGDGRSHENGYQGDDGNGVEAELMDFFHYLFPEQLAFPGRAEDFCHQEDISSYCAYHLDFEIWPGQARTVFRIANVAIFRYKLF